MSKETFLQLRQDLSRSYEITGLTQEDMLGFTLEVEDGLPVNVYFDEIHDQIVFFCGLGEVPEEQRAAVLEKAMGLNLFAAATRGGALGFDAETHLLSLARVVPALQFGLPAFQLELQQFADTAWRTLTEIAALEKAADPAPDDGLPPPSHTIKV